MFKKWDNILQKWVTKGSIVKGEGKFTNMMYRGTVSLASQNAGVVAVGSPVEGIRTTADSEDSPEEYDEGALKKSIKETSASVYVYEYGKGKGWVQRGAKIEGLAKGYSSVLSLATSSDGSRIVVGVSKKKSEYKDDFFGYSYPSCESADSHDSLQGCTYEFQDVILFEWDGAEWIQIGQGLEGAEVIDVAISNDGTVLVLTRGGHPHHQKLQTVVYRLQEK